MTTFAVDARAAAEVPAGRGRYVRELLTALAASGGDERWLLLCREPAPLALDERFVWHRIAAPDPLWHLLAARAANRHADALLSTNSYLTAWFTRVPTAVVVHDMVAFVEPGWAQRRAGRIERATLGIAVRRAAAFACDSAATQRDLVARFPAAAGRTEAIPLATSATFAPPATRLPPPDRPFVLAVGTLEPRKNLTRLIDAWTELPPAVRGEHELVLVGPTGWQAEEILARAAAAGVRMPGYVTDEELAGLYATCTAFVYPALYEGFGLPVLEALACGAPTITSDVSSLPEVSGDAALLVDPRDRAAIGAALAELLGSPERREELRRRGLERAQAFSWAATATRTRDLLRRIAAQPSARR